MQKTIIKIQWINVGFLQKRCNGATKQRCNISILHFYVGSNSMNFIYNYIFILYIYYNIYII